MNVFSLAKGLVQAYRGGIFWVRLNEDDVDAPLFGHTSECPDKIGRNPFKSISFIIVARLTSGAFRGVEFIFALSERSA